MRLIALILTGLSLVFVAPALSAQDETPPPAGDQKAQEGDATEGTDEAQDDGTAEDVWTAPEVFDTLYDEFKALAGEFQEKGVAGTDPRVKALREKVTAFNDERTATELSVAVEIQLIRWGREVGDLEKDAFERLDAVEPQHAGLRQMWADWHFSRNEFNRTREILEAKPIDFAKFPRAAVLLAQSMALMNDFEQAESLLNSIPPSASLTPALLDEIYRVRSTLIEPFIEDWRKEAAIREREAQADDLPRVQIDTPKGPVIVELFENEAPNTVANFIQLIDEGFYIGMPFKPAITGYYIQVGNPANQVGANTVKTTTDINWTIADELPEDSYRKHFYGSLSMVIKGLTPDSGATEFSIRLRPDSTRNGRNTVFGRVIEGMNVVWQLQAEDTIEGMTVVRKRDHEYVAERIHPTPPADEGGTESAGDASDDTSAQSETDTDDGGGTSDDTSQNDG